MVNASITVAMNSGIPIGKEYCQDIDIIKEKLYEELAKLSKREGY